MFIDVNGWSGIRLISPLVKGKGNIGLCGKFLEYDEYFVPKSMLVSLRFMSVRFDVDTSARIKSTQPKAHCYRDLLMVTGLWVILPDASLILYLAELHIGYTPRSPLSFG